MRIYSNKGNVSGAGFLVSEKQILSCAHVVADALRIKRITTEMLPLREFALTQLW